MSNKNRFQELAELDKKHFLHPTSSIKQQQEDGPAFIFSEGKGIYLYDILGNKVIDGMSSLWNVNIGHGRKEIVEAAAEQMSKLAYSSCFNTFSNEPVIKLSEKISQITPGDLNTTFFTSGGSESNDTAIKLVRHYWILKGEKDRKKIISRKKSYHGLAMGATNATGLKPFRDFSNTFSPDFFHVEDQSIEALVDLIEKEGPETIAAFISEPVQGSGGVHVPPVDYFKECRTVCDKYGILFIADEVITGFGRTGKYFGMEHFGVIPDIMSIAKGVTSGYAQLGGVIISKKIHEDLIEHSTDTFLHGYTYSGHPTACAVALRNIQVIEEENLIENARLMGEEMLKGFKWIQQEQNIVGEVRGLGLLGAIELGKGKSTNERFNNPLAPLVVKEAAKRGLMFRSVIFEGQDTLVFSPPLIINKHEVHKMIEVIFDSISAVKMKHNEKELI
ncbi:aminotransferase family protein [Peribacillus frigoritolerans]|uniref:aminotransferase family protein n=1 Tax=Peribacillus castrilensis TaxID=2897690 RepID=UPI003DA4513F